MPQPLSELNGPFGALFSDLDGTLTTGGVVEPSTYAVLAELDDQGIPVIIVTGRPAGWGQALMTIAPVAAVVSENGGVSFFRDPDGGLEKIYGVPADSIPDWRRRMEAAAADAIATTPGARMSSDSCYREVDLAIDWNEEVSLSVEAGDAMVELLRSRGLAASRSSVHVNFGPPEFDKLTASEQIIARLFGTADSRADYVFIGDSLNDAPMFHGFAKSVGVANVRDWWDLLEHTPRYITSSPEGAGFRELAAHILGTR